MHAIEHIRTNIGWQFAPDRMIERLAPRPDPQLEEVYRRRGLILIHIPKNAGTSVEEALFGYRVRHRTWREVQATCPRAWRDLPKIAVIRDPVDRFLSAFDYLKSGGRNEHDRMFSAKVIGNKSVCAFIDLLSDSRSYRDTAMRYFHFRRQTDYVCDKTRIMVDELIPFGNMAEGLTRIAGVRPGSLTHANKTAGARTDRSDLSQRQIDQITRLYTTDANLYAQACAAWLVAYPDTVKHQDGAAG